MYNQEVIYLLSAVWLRLKDPAQQQMMSYQNCKYTQFRGSLSVKYEQSSTQALRIDPILTQKE